MTSLASSLRAMSRSRPLSSVEIECISVASSSEDVRVLIDAVGEGMLLTTPAHLKALDPTPGLGLIDEGSIIFAPLLPPSSGTAWLENWVAYEVSHITSRSGDNTPIISLAFCAYVPPDPPPGHTHFLHDHGPDLVMMGLPTHLVVPLAPQGYTQARLLLKRKHTEPIPGKTAMSSPAAECEEDDGDGVVNKPRVFRDNDGVPRTYQPVHVALTTLVMTANWRTMSVDRLQLMHPTNAGYSLETDVLFWVKYREMPPSDVSDPDRRIMYRISRYDGANVTTNPELTSRASQWHWQHLNWTYLSIFDFLRNPISMSDLSKFYDDCTEWPRELICKAIEDWNGWVSIRFSHQFSESWPSVRAWLKDTPHQGDAQQYHHDGLHVRHMVESLLFRFYSAISSPSPQTNYSGISFTSPGAVHALMRAMDADFVTNVISMNTLPHYSFRHPRTAADQIIGNTTYFHTATSRSPSVTSRSPSQPPFTPLSPSPSSTITSIPREPKGVCPYHLSSLLNIPNSNGCSYPDNCALSHPATISAITKPAAMAAVGGKLSPKTASLLVEHIEAKSGSFSQL